MRDSRVISRVAKRQGFLALAVCLLFILTACEIDMSLKLSGGNPPTFNPFGSGNLAFFWVREASWDEPKLTPMERGMTDEKSILWEVWPNGADSKIWNLPDITYGQIPSGFRQKVPDKGSAPPLEEGKLYEAGGPASNANGGSIFFTIRKGQAIEVPESY